MKAYQLKISIKNSKPPIWRRCIVPAGITFSQLSFILDNVMGWGGYHLSKFEFYHLELELREDDGLQPFLPYDYDLMDSSKTCINEYMESQKWFTYIYDFGDDWQHRVTIEKVLDDYPYNYPQVLKFKGACPMEDCGGIDGYYETLDILEDRSHEEHASRKEWAESMLYDDDYDIDEVNKKLQESCAVTMKAGEERTKTEIYEDIFAGKLGLIGDKRAQKKGGLLKSREHRTNDKLTQIVDMIIQKTIDKKTSKIVDNDEIIKNTLQEAEREMQQYARDLANEIRRESDSESDSDSEAIELEEILEAYTKEDVKELAKEYGLRKISALKKKDLIQRVSEEMLRPESMASNFLILHDEEIEAFEKAVTFGNGYSPENNEEELFDRLVFMGYVGIRFNEKVDIPESVKKIYQIINDDEFKQNRKYVSWLNDCFLVAAKLYGVVEPPVILKLLKRNKAVQFSEESLLKYFSMIPLREQQFILLDDLFIHKDLLIKENYKNLLRCQQDKKYYIPTYHEIKDFAENGYFSTDKCMKKLIAFLENQADMTQEEAQNLGAAIQREICFGEDMHDILGMLEMEEIILPSEEDYKRLVELIIELWNETRMLLNRGYKPNELLKMNGKNAYFTGGKMPTIVAGSSNMADLLQQNRNEIEQMGFHLDLESNADSKLVYTMEDGKDGEIRRTEKKIYPNDPCPCGSNKKYKKCCGRK